MQKMSGLLRCVPSSALPGTGYLFLYVYNGHHKILVDLILFVIWGPTWLYVTICRKVKTFFYGSQGGMV